MVYSPKLTLVANGYNSIGVGLALGETIYFGSLEFTDDRFGNLSLSPEGGDPGAIFVGMVHGGTLSLHTVLEESSNEGDASSAGGASSSFLSPRGCNMVTLVVSPTKGHPRCCHTAVGELASVGG
jgi:hypothetical protein